jgi:MFS family permease
LARIKSLGSWLIILLILMATAVMAVVWPLIAQSLNFSGLGSVFGGAARPATTMAPIVVPIPEPIASMVNTTQLVLAGWQAFAFLFAVVTVSVIGAGLVITLLMRLGGKFTGQVAASEDYQTSVASLESKNSEKLKAKRASQPEPNKPDGYVYGLDPISFSLLVLFFVALLATLVYGLVSPTGEIVLFGQTFYSGLPLIIALFIITIPLLALLARRKRLNAVADNDNAPIPWDFIAVLITGLLVVGVGLGLMLYINNPL